MYYVCSDIHGNFKRFNALLEKLNEDDKLIVLGDCIDRGDDGLKILKYIMNHQEKITLLCGNHEQLMYEKLSMDYQDKKIGHEPSRYTMWLSSRNGGQITYDDYLKEDENTQNKIFEFLSKLPFIEIIEVNGIKYHLSHAGTIPRFDEKNVLSKDIWYREDLHKYQIEQIVWDNPYRDDGYMLFSSYPENCISIFGHVPVQYIRDDASDFTILEHENTINIDSGCAYCKIKDDRLKTALSVYCLDTKEVFYIE